MLLALHSHSLFRPPFPDGWPGKARICSAITRFASWPISQLHSTSSAHPTPSLPLGSCWGKEEEKVEPSPRRSNLPYEFTTLSLNRYPQLNIHQTNSPQWMSPSHSESLVTKTFSFHLSPLHPQFHHPRSLPFGNALNTHPVLLTLVLWGCNPAGNFQRWFHSVS